ncbi:hypothetical protein [Pararhodobacter sp.]|uniref:hypothetical protein n=1 Tax=Pararhodobacter sp. TaxID=2127056 RepID=UPI002AFDDAE0|nr:hypothetical protein [Pararhodobacter sp.]
MIRGVVILLALVIGLATAFVIGGRVAHLRMVFGTALPAWSTQLEADAGVLSGQGTVNGALLRWRMTGVDLAGPRWQVALSGAEWQVSGVAHWQGTRLRVEDLAGLIPASQLSAMARGMLAISAGSVALAMPQGALTDGQLAARGRDLVLGDPLPDGEIVVTWTEGAWIAVSP